MLWNSLIKSLTLFIEHLTSIRKFLLFAPIVIKRLRVFGSGKLDLNNVYMIILTDFRKLSDKISRNDAIFISPTLALKD
jgi:hypothetical protein